MLQAQRLSHAHSLEQAQRSRQISFRRFDPFLQFPVRFLHLFLVHEQTHLPQAHEHVDGVEKRQTRVREIDDTRGPKTTTTTILLPVDIVVHFDEREPAEKDERGDVSERVEF
tara:strand:+ start:830 stop:1168 length:339 start_codon:yes stop_codon:yes gene_type:complete